VEQNLSTISRQGINVLHSRSGFFCARWRLLVLIGILTVLTTFVWLTERLEVYSANHAAFSLQSPLRAATDESTDLLYNGNMDQAGFYWRPPNHWIAGGWFEWFSTQPFNFPEFGDGGERGFYHTYGSSQRLQLWGNDYAAGLMQSMTVAPCVYYQFQAYGQTRPGNQDPPPVNVPSHMKVGLEPYGWMSGRSTSDYDPGLEPENFPASVVWSPEATHNFSFAPYSVIAEALSDTLTVILYSYPEVDIDGGVIWNDTIWDTASLTQVATPNGMLLATGNLPSADGKISQVVDTTVFNAATLQWQTSDPAYSQILYHYVGPVSGPPPPPIADHTDDFEHQTSVDWTARMAHSIKLTDLSPASVYDVALLSRRWTGSACETSVYVMRIQTTDLIVPTGFLPPPSDDVWDLHVIPLQQSAYVWWRSDSSAYSQVLYRPAVTYTVAPPLSYTVYLPLAFAGPQNLSTADFEFHTTPAADKDTVHWYYLSDLEPDTEYEFVALIAWTENNIDYVARSELESFTTGVYAQTTDIPWNELPPELKETLCAEAGVCSEDH